MVKLNSKKRKNYALIKKKIGIRLAPALTFINS